jgi:hypothetical protein
MGTLAYVICMETHISMTRWDIEEVIKPEGSALIVD